MGAKEKSVPSKRKQTAKPSPPVVWSAKFNAELGHSAVNATSGLLSELGLFRI